METTQFQQKFDEWCIIELFGHTTLAGRVSEQTIGGSSFIRLDVPEVDDQAAFTKLYGPGAVYSITPVSEEVARTAINHIRARPISVYYLPQPSPTPAVVDNHPSDETDDEFVLKCEKCGGPLKDVDYHEGLDLADGYLCPSCGHKTLF